MEVNYKEWRVTNMGLDRKLNYTLVLQLTSSAYLLILFLTDKSYEGSTYTLFFMSLVPIISNYINLKNKIKHNHNGINKYINKLILCDIIIVIVMSSLRYLINN
jgi:hypothetical protein